MSFPAGKQVQASTAGTAASNELLFELHSPTATVSFAESSSNQSYPVDVASWAANALQSLNLKKDAKGTGALLTIPLDQGLKLPSSFVKRPMIPKSPTSKRRDRSSLRKRDALLEGREGTRQRRRWENDHLKGVPNAQPPQPSDWAVQPTHPVVHVPYHLAKHWDDISARPSPAAKKKMDQSVGRIPRDVRDAAKRNRIFKTWVRSVEEPVRWFVTNRLAQMDASASVSSSTTDLAGDITPRARSRQIDSASRTSDRADDLSDMEIVSPGRDISDIDFTTDNSDDEIIVFRGRGRKKTRDGTPGMMYHHLFPSHQQAKSVLALQRDEDWQELLPIGMQSRNISSQDDSNPSAMWDAASWRVVPGRPSDGNGGSPAAMLFTPDQESNSTYRRWIVHSVALYYGLESTSVDDGDTQRRYVFVGPKSSNPMKPVLIALPGPMWEQL